MQEKDPETGKTVERQTYRREWEARDVEREQRHNGPDRSDDPAKTPVTRKDEALANKKSEQEHIEERLRDHATAVKDPQLKGALSKLALMDATLRTADVPEKERREAVDTMRRTLARNIATGKVYPVEKLPNVSKEQIQAARDKAHKQMRQEQGKSPQWPNWNAERHHNIEREQTKDKDRSR